MVTLVAVASVLSEAPPTPPQSPPPMEVSPEEAQKLFRLRLALATIAQLKTKVNTLRAEEEIAAVRVNLIRRRPTIAPKPKGSVAKVLKRHEREFRVRSWALELTEANLALLRVDTMIKALADEFTRQFAVAEPVTRAPTSA